MIEGAAAPAEVVVKLQRVAFLLLVSAAACGSGPTAEELEYCRLYETACRRQVECGAVVVGQAATVAACVSEVHCLELLPSLRAAGAAIRSADVRSCGAALAALSCAEVASRRLVGAAPACATLLEGVGEAGQSCRGGIANGGCRAGLSCDLSKGCPGSCVGKRAVACVEGGCPSGQYCVGPDVGCQARSGAGEPCRAVSLDLPWESSCAAGYQCMNDSQGRGSCVASLAAGVACSSGNPYTCQEGLSCLDDKCVPSGKEGQPCRSFTECAVGLACLGHVCSQRRPEGAPCNREVAACAPGLTCLGSGRCGALGSTTTVVTSGPLLKAGARCDQGGGVCPLGTACRCEDATCATLLCAPGPRLGESCRPATVSCGGGCMTTKEFGFDPYRCVEGVCDFLSDGYRCVAPRLPGESCSFTARQATLECLSFVCQGGRCLDYVDQECKR